MKTSRINFEEVNFDEYDPDLADILEQNIRTIFSLQQQELKNRTLEQRFSDRITSSAGHLTFLLGHLFFIIVYILVNSGLLGIVPFDPYPFNLLIGLITVEVLFLSTFILISQNRMQDEANRRADLDLQMSLLNQYELTRVLKMLDHIEDKLGIDNEADQELRKLEEHISPEDVLIEMELVRRKALKKQRISQVKSDNS